MKALKAFVWVWLFLTLRSAMAQFDSLHVYVGYGYSIHQSDAASFQGRIDGKGFPTGDATSNLFHIPFRAGHKRWQLLGNFGFIWKKPHQRGDTAFRTALNTTGYGIGYAVFRQGGLRVSPFLGYRSISWVYDFNTEDELGRGQMSGWFRRKYTLRYARHHLDLGVNVEYGTKFLFGARFGYPIPLGDGVWRLRRERFDNDTVIAFGNYIDFYVAYGFQIPRRYQGRSG